MTHADNSRGQLDSLLRRALVQLGEWQRKYGEHNPYWAPPAGDVRLAEDIDDALATPAPGAPGQEAAVDPWHAAVLNECMLTEACYQEADPAGTVKALIDWHVGNGAAVQAVGAWQDIATAPKDGTWLLLWEQYSTVPFVGRWSINSWSPSHEHVDAEGGWDGAVVVDNISMPVTHWQPLPNDPAALPAGAGEKTS